MSESERELPKPTPETQHFWDGTGRENLDFRDVKKPVKFIFRRGIFVLLAAVQILK